MKSTTVRMVHEKVKPGDSPESPGVGGKTVDLITAHITVEGNLDDVQKERLLAISTRCPVHRTLEGGPTMVNELEVVKPRQQGA